VATERDAEPTGPGGTGREGPAGSRPSRRRATLWFLALSNATLALAIARNLILVPVYLRFISIEEYGAWLATGAALSYLVLSDFGVVGVVMQGSGSAYGSGDKHALGAIVGAGLVLSLAISSALFVLVFLATPFVPRTMGFEGELSLRLARCFLIVGVSNSLNVVSQTAAGVLRGLQRPKLPGFVEIFSELFGILATLILLFRGWGLYSIPLGPALAIVGALAVNVGACLRWCVRKLDVPLHFRGDTLRKIWQDSLYQLLGTIALRVQARGDTFLVGWILGPHAAAQYGLTVRAHETVRMLMVSVGGALLPSLSHLYGDVDREKFRQTVQFTIGVFAVLSSVGMGAVIARNEDFVSLWVGPELFGGMALTVLMAIHGVLVTLGDGYYGALFAGAEFPRLSSVLLRTAALRAGLTMLLAQLGIWGAGAAASLAGAYQLFALEAAASGTLGTDRRTRVGSARRVGQIVIPPLAVAGLAWWLLPGAQSWRGLAVSAGGITIAAAFASLALNSSLRRALVEEARAFRFSGTTAVGHVRLGGPE
jgi:O-antigen/teichoic acid export membrane protein